MKREQFINLGGTIAAALAPVILKPSDTIHRTHLEYIAGVAADLAELIGDEADKGMATPATGSRTA
jgi:hypothetical protein